MKKSIIWYLSEDKEFPIELWKHPKFSIVLNKIPMKDCTKLEPHSDDINILYLAVDSNRWKEIGPDFLRLYEIHPNISIILIESPDFENLHKELVNKNKIEVLEYPVHKRCLRLIIDRTIQAEFYKFAAMDIGNSCLTNVGFFEGVFDLAHKERKNAEGAVSALEAILEFEKKVKESQDEINVAVERVNDLKNEELLQLHERIKANEKLDQLREKELREALEQKTAIEKTLNYSRIEEIQMNKIIRAQDKISKYSDQEIKDLLQENKDLKKKLGIPVAD